MSGSRSGRASIDVLLVAGEASGDLHGATLASALSALAPGVRIAGMGGERMAAAGVRLLRRVERVTVVGGTEAFGRLPALWSAFKAYFPFATGRSEPVVVVEVTAVGGKETVLLVEDEAAVRELTRRILTGHGYHVLEAFDGQDALDVVARYSGRIDLLVTDMVMPRMNGRNLAEKLSASMPGLAVLFLSGYTNADILRREPDEPKGNHRLLQKPFTTHSLATAVREALDGTYHSTGSGTKRTSRDR